MQRRFVQIGVDADEARYETEHSAARSDAAERGVGDEAVTDAGVSGEVDDETVRHSRRGVELGRLVEDRRFEVADLRAGLDAEIADQAFAYILISAQRFCLAPAAVQGEEAQRPQPLPPRVFCEQPVKLLEHRGDVAIVEPRGDVVFHQSEMTITQPVGRILTIVGLGQLWHDPPQLARRCERRRSGGEVVAGQRSEARRA